MFTKKTVFVVGAGASSEMGLPVGEQLKSVISSKIDLRFDNGYDMSKGDKGVFQAITALCQERGSRDVNPLCGAGRIIASAMPQAMSIDNFLHTHADDENIVLAGKLGIAASILEAESKSSIRYEERLNRIDFSNNPGIWLNSFCRMLTEGLRKSDLSQIFDNVSLITFNYDRCIEHYISQWIANYMQVPLAEAQELTNNLTVIHPYGQVGKLPWQKGPSPSVDYGVIDRSRELAKFALQLRTFTERVDDEVMLSRMRGLISEAVRVVYLGFSFGEMNMRLMQIEETGPFKTTYGTTFKMSEANTEAVRGRITTALSVHGQASLSFIHHLKNISANQMLNDYWYELAG